MIDPLRVYGESLTSAADPAWLRLADGTVLRLPLERYLASADDTDAPILAAARGPVLDVGCGAGRHLHALAKRGVFALGVDISPTAVRLARQKGGRAILGSIFDEVPGPGTWRTALLIDGNIGIGGAPERLLARISKLLATDGQIIVELDSPELATRPVLARIETPQSTSSWFKWARVTSTDIATIACGAGFQIAQGWEREGRWFARLHRAARQKGWSGPTSPRP